METNNTQQLLPVPDHIEKAEMLKNGLNPEYAENMNRLYELGKLSVANVNKEV